MDSAKKHQIVSIKAEELVCEITYETFKNNSAKF